MSQSHINPQNKVSIENILEKLPTRFQSAEAIDMDVIFQFQLNDAFAFYIKIYQCQCEIVKQQHGDPNITLLMSQSTFIALMSGEIDGMNAFLKGQLKAHGNVLLAASLSKLFKKQPGDDQKLNTV